MQTGGLPNTGSSSSSSKSKGSSLDGKNPIIDYDTSNVNTDADEKVNEVNLSELSEYGKLMYKTLISNATLLTDIQVIRMLQAEGITKKDREIIRNILGV